MISFIEGIVEEKNPTYVIINANGVGYHINISLHTYSFVPPNKQYRLHTILIIREDAHILFGFAQKDEKEVFEQLITVSGVGASIARMILSSMKPDDVKQNILSGNVSALKNVKGIGAKTAERIIVDLKDKIGMPGGETSQISFFQNNTMQQEALSALVMLGFSKQVAEKAMEKTIKTLGEAKTVEELIKNTLKNI